MTDALARTPEQPAVLDTSELGARLALVRWHMGWNVSEAEQNCGLSQNSWSNWEKGARPRKFQDVTEAIAKAANVDLMWLMTGRTFAAPVTSKLPGLDSNQEPIGSQSGLVTRLADHTPKRVRVRVGEPREVVSIRAQG